MKRVKIYANMCLYPGCPSKQDKYEGNFFCLSRDKTERDNWLRRINREDLINARGNLHQLRICDKHFATHMFLTKERNSLTHRAVPFALKRPTRCLYPDCERKRTDSENITFFCLPKTKPRRDIWLQLMKMEELKHEKDSTLANYRICADHFEKNMFRTAEKKSLIPNAVPKEVLVVKEYQDEKTSTPTESEHLYLRTWKDSSRSSKTVAKYEEEKSSTSKESEHVQFKNWKNDSKAGAFVENIKHEEVESSPCIKSEHIYLNAWSNDSPNSSTVENNTNVADSLTFTTIKEEIDRKEEPNDFLEENDEVDMKPVLPIKEEPDNFSEENVGEKTLKNVWEQKRIKKSCEEKRDNKSSA